VLRDCGNEKLQICKNGCKTAQLLAAQHSIPPFSESPYPTTNGTGMGWGLSSDTSTRSPISTILDPPLSITQVTNRTLLNRNCPSILGVTIMRSTRHNYHNVTFKPRAYRRANRRKINVFTANANNKITQYHRKKRTTVVSSTAEI